MFLEIKRGDGSPFFGYTIEEEQAIQIVKQTLPRGKALVSSLGDEVRLEVKGENPSVNASYDPPEVDEGFIRRLEARVESLETRANGNDARHHDEIPRMFAVYGDHFKGWLERLEKLETALYSHTTPEEFSELESRVDELEKRAKCVPFHRHFDREDGSFRWHIIEATGPGFGDDPEWAHRQQKLVGGIPGYAPDYPDNPANAA